MMNIEDVLSQGRLAELRLKREKARAQAYKEALPIIGTEALSELKALMNIFDESVYLLFAELYDGEIGGFYYTKAAGETKGYLPDIESTWQALRFLEKSGMLGDNCAYGAPLLSGIITKISDFAVSLQKKDGFFYHPQWGRRISVWRKGRDLGYAVEIIKETGANTNYPLPTETEEKSRTSALPDNLKSVEAFEGYVEKLNFPERPLFFSGELTSQKLQIISRGKEYVDVIRRALIKYDWHWLWQESDNYDSVNALVRLCESFNFSEIVLPNQEKLLNAAIKAMLDGKADDVRACDNPWKTINALLRFLRKNVAYDELYRLRSVLCKNAYRLIYQTHRKVLSFRCPDGGFVYFPNKTQFISQGAKASVDGVLSGEINGTCLATISVVDNMCLALGIPVVPMYTEDDGKVFIDVILGLGKKTKLYKNDDEARISYGVSENQRLRK